MDVEEIFSDKFTPKERRSLWWFKYVKIGLTMFEGSRSKTAKYLGVSVRFVRNIMSEYPELKVEFPVPQYNQNLYQCKPKVRKVELHENRKYKSILKYKYKVCGKTFDSIEELSSHFNISLGEAEVWVKARLTENRDFIRIVSTPVDAAGNEIDPKDFDKLDSREWGKF